MATMKFEIDAEVRADVGKGASRRLRHADKVPAVVYGAGEAAISLTLDHNKTLNALSHESFYSRILTLKVGSKSEKVILKAVQRNPAKPRVNHVDFLRVRADQKLHMNIPLHFLGGEETPGTKEGGVINHIISDVEISCLPADLPEYIAVDLSNLGLDESIHLSQLQLPKGVEIVALAHGEEAHDIAVVSCHIPRIIEEEVDITEEAAAPEGEGAVKAEGSEGEKKE